MDFGVLPPEVNSGRMYAGPGSGPMMAAAAAWDELAGELESAASSYRSVISSLTSGSWAGPASASMAAAAAPYAAWTSATAIQAGQAATQAKAAAMAYEAAFAATVPPPVIAANRSLLLSLVATNFLGQNTAAIAATEAHYGAMWAQDATAMYGYAGASASASAVTPFTAPPQTTNAGGLAAQSAAVAQATGTSAGTGAQTLSGLIPQLLQSLANASTSYNSQVSAILNGLTGSSSASSIYSSLFSIGGSADKFILPANDAMITAIFGLVQFQKFFHPLGLGGALNGILPNLGAGLGLESHALGPAGLGAAKTISASMGSASSAGGLSVPPSWTAATPAIRMVTAILPGTSLGAASTVMAPESLLGQLGLASMAGGALGRTAPQVGFSSPNDPNKPAKLERLVAEFSQQPGNKNKAVQHWHTDEAGLDDLLADLSKKPGIHAVHVNDDGQARTEPRRSQFN